MPSDCRQITIDGPAASGKSSVACAVARELGGYYINTGDMYRTVAWQALVHGVDPAADPESVGALLSKLEMGLERGASGQPELVLNGEIVPQSAIRHPDVAVAASSVARLPAVRAWLVERQRATRSLGLIVMEGRDIGTVVFPEAAHKFFLTASPEVRARRRLNQAGESVEGATVASVAAEIAARDEADRTRAVAPLRPAADAVVIDSSDLTLEVVTAAIVRTVRRQAGGG